MRIIRGFTNIPPEFRGAVATIGNFDGVHRGHQEIFARLRRMSRGHGGAPMVAISFEPHPRTFLAVQQPLARITGLRAKARWLDRYGMEALLVLPFNRNLATLLAPDFVQRFLVEGLGVREVIVGENFRFGAGGSGNLETLIQIGEKSGFGVYGEPLLREQGEIISSSRIRITLAQGDLHAAEAMLGHPFEVEGRVRMGAKRGRLMGFPTANLPMAGMLHPPHGVWVVEGQLHGHSLPGVANLGHHPTFVDAGINLETHFLVPCGDLYGRRLRVRFLKFLRPEQKFSGMEALKQQIARDVRAAQDHFAATNPPGPGER